MVAALKEVSSHGHDAWLNGRPPHAASSGECDSHSDGAGRGGCAVSRCRTSGFSEKGNWQHENRAMEQRARVPIASRLTPLCAKQGRCRAAASVDVPPSVEEDLLFSCPGKRNNDARSQKTHKEGRKYIGVPRAAHLFRESAPKWLDVLPLATIWNCGDWGQAHMRSGQTPTGNPPQGRAGLLLCWTSLQLLAAGKLRAKQEKAVQWQNASGGCCSRCRAAGGAG